MNELRIILLLAGVAIIGLLYLFRKRQLDESGAEAEPMRRMEPGFDRGSSDEVSAGRSEPPLSTPSTSSPSPADGPEVYSPASTTPAADAAPDADAATPPLESTSIPVVTEKVVVLHMLPKSQAAFAGSEFIDALRAEGLRFGRFEIFHRFTNPEDIGPDAPSLYSVANLVKPGSFNLRDVENQEFKGASMFLVLPGPEDPVAAFADMLATGRRLAATLDGQLVDSQGTHLSRQRASHMREDIINYQHGMTAQHPVD